MAPDGAGQITRRISPAFRPGTRAWAAVAQGSSVGYTQSPWERRWRPKPVVAALREALPKAELLFSTTTPTGQAQARRLLTEVDHFLYFPFDLPWVVSRVLARLQPSAIVLLEAEIWPNLLWAARRRKVPVIIANGHISDRTLRRAARLRPLLAPLLEGITRYLAQSEMIRDRAIALGLAAEQSRRDRSHQVRPGGAAPPA